MNRIKKEVIEKIKYLRTQGYSLPEIHREIGVSKSTVLRYIQGVQMLPEYLSIWLAKRGGSTRRRLIKEEEAFMNGKNIVGKLTEKEKFLILSTLYWAEGNKKDFILINSDPYLIRVFLKCIRDVLAISNDRIRIGLRLFEDLDRQESIKFWSQVTSIPEDSIVSFEIIKGKKTGKLRYGMCRIRILKGADLLRKVFGINKALSGLFSSRLYTNKAP